MNLMFWTGWACWIIEIIFLGLFCDSTINYISYITKIFM